MIGLVVLVMLSLLYPHDEPEPSREYKFKPDGEINLLDDTMIREKLLARGRYLIRHRIDEDKHPVIIAQIPDRQSIPRPTVLVPATILPAKKTFSKSIGYARPPEEGRTSDKYRRIITIDIAGENVGHLF